VFEASGKIKQVTVLRNEAPFAVSDAFEDSVCQRAILYVPDTVNYKGQEPWSKFKNKVARKECKLTYIVDGTTYGEPQNVMAGSPVEALDEPQKEGHDFSGWQGVPDIMPAEETIVNGYFEYEIKFYEKDATSEDNRLLKNNEYKFFCGDKVVLPVEALARSGYKYTLSGLTENDIKEDDVANEDITMAAKDISVVVTYDKAEEELVYNNVKYKVFTMEDRAEVIGCSVDATTLNIPATVNYEDKSYPVTAIQASAFKGNGNLKSVTINVKTIGDYAFQGCFALTTVTMPESLDSIGQQAFANTALNSVKVPYAPKMGKEIFYWCTKLTTIDFDNKLTALPERIFQGCLSLEEVTIPEQITTIGDFAFANCSTIKNLTLPAAVTKLGSYAFYNVFGNGDELVVERSTLPEASENTFDEDAYKDALLKTTDTEVANKEPWKNFANVEGSSSEQCAAPTIEYAGGKLKFTFDPSSFEPGKINEGKIKDGVTIISKITIDDTSENSINEVELSKNYIVTAYAKKDGCRRSATVTKTFKFMNGDVNLNGEINIVDAQLIVNKIVGKIDALSREFNIDLDSEENTLDPQ